MRKLPIALFSASALFASTVTAQVTWQGEWTDATTFAGATPSWSPAFGGGDFSTTQAPSATTITATNASFVYFSPDSGFDASTATGSTVEFSMKVNSQEAGKDFAGSVRIFGSDDNGTERRFDLNIADDGVQFFTAGQSAALDTTVFNTYRLTFGGNSASLYLNGNNVATISGQPGGSNLITGSDLRIGVTSGSDTVGGTTEWEYVRWTNAGQFSPVPEPAAFASLLGVLALGTVALRRRRRA